ncbi:MAG: sulfoquinovosidase [Thermoleophilaceae bacterium]|nr:sulfoquinovosidase [Thermoleophilaceae bacterium]
MIAARIALLTVVLAATAAPARAADTVLSAPSGARVVVQRDPLRISFVDASGRTVLRQAQPAGGFGIVPPIAEVQYGTLSPPPAAVYAPFAFLVGSHRVSQTPAGQWQGTLQQVTEEGTVYAATKMLAATREGTALKLKLATSDPTGRTLEVTIAPRGRAFQVSARPVPAAGVAAMADAFASSPAEAFHGFGGRHDAVDAHGTEFFTYLQQENVGSGSGDRLTAPATPGKDRYMFPNGPYATYYAQSQFVSSAGYGFWLDRNEIARWRMDSDRADAWHVEVAAPALDYVVAPGSPRSAIGTLTRLTGRQPVPPDWALGSLLDREVKYPSDPADQHQAEIAKDIADMRSHRVKLDGYRIEGAAELPPKVLKADIAKFKRLGVHVLVYFRGFVGKDTTGTDSPSQYDEAVAKGYVATHADGSPYTFTSNFNADGAVIDFTNPAAVAWWQARIRKALRTGADGFMQDFGEQVFDDMHFHDGSTGAQVHNRFPILFHRATARAVAAFRRTHPHRRIWWFTRSGYSGSAAYEPGNFPGDETTDWTRSSGLASQTTDMLNRAVGGAYGFTTDIGGYFDVGPYPATTKELFVRWAEWAALSPFFRIHGSVLAGTHTPWSYDAETLRLYKRMAALHRRARPLIRALWRSADRTGIPPTRPLWLQFPGDERAAGQDQEWALGPNVIAAPVVTEGATTRSVYLPAGCWRGAGVRVHGPAQRTVKAPLGKLPYFVRCGRSPL